jgi:iron complex transport system substrate-binding protein
MALAALMAAAGCTVPPPRAALRAERPMRIVTLDDCSAQFVLKLADRDAIAALSPDAAAPFAYLRAQAAGLPRVRPTAENILALEPDLVVRAYGGDAGIGPLLQRAGVPVHQLGFGQGFDAVRANVRGVAAAVGQPARGEAVLADFDRRLAALQATATGASMLYVTRGGVTTGPGSDVDLMIRSAGLRNFETRPGWNPLPLERLVSGAPEMAATAFFGADGGDLDYWSSARHPVIRRILRDAPVAALDGATTVCGGWYMIEAIETLAAAAGRAAP